MELRLSNTPLVAFLMGHTPSACERHRVEEEEEEEEDITREEAQAVVEEEARGRGEGGRGVEGR